MPLTRDFRETVMARVKSDPAFRSELIVEATNAFLMDDMETGKALLRDYLNATESIANIARELQVNEKSLRRMLGPKGNPTLKNFLSLLKVCSSMAPHTSGLPPLIPQTGAGKMAGYRFYGRSRR